MGTYEHVIGVEASMIEGQEGVVGADGATTEEEIAGPKQQHLICFVVELMLVQRGLQPFDWCMMGQSSFFLACWNC
jgi:hypothetical protein